jgi:hypothetical protein
VVLQNIIPFIYIFIIINFIIHYKYNNNKKNNNNKKIIGIY